MTERTIVTGGRRAGKTSAMAELSREYLAARMDRYPYLASSSVNVRPRVNAGDRVSAVLEPDRRIWAFGSETDRDRFVAEYPTAEKLEALP